MLLNSGSHGTDDVAGLGNAYQPAALKLKSLWDKGQTNLLPPWQNAESIAASATGKKCCNIYQKYC